MDASGTGHRALAGPSRRARQLWAGVGRLADAVATGLLAVMVAVTGTVTDAWRLRRTDEGGVADEAAMIAIVLAAAVLIGGIVFALVEGAGENLESIELPGG